MHIIMVSWLKGKSLPVTGYGGIERYTMTVARELCRQGNEVTLIAPPGSTSDFCEVIQTNDMVEAAAIINCISADVVHDNTVWALDSVVRQGVRHPHISVTHVNHAIGFSKNVVYMSKSQRAGHAQQMGKDLSASPVVYCPIDPELKPVGLPRAEYLLYLGAVVEHKGVLESANVAHLLRRTLIIAGSAAGEYANRIATLVPDVLFVGEVSGKYKHELIEQAFALMSLFNNHNGWAEPGCGTFGESVALGTPVAAFPNGVMPELVVDGCNGWLANSVDDIATAMEYAPYPTQENISKSAQQYNAENIVKQYLHLYERVISGETWG